MVAFTYKPSTWEEHIGTGVQILPGLHETLFERDNNLYFRVYHKLVKLLILLLELFC